MTSPRGSRLLVCLLGSFLAIALLGASAEYRQHEASKAVQATTQLVTRFAAEVASDRLTDYRIEQLYTQFHELRVELRAHLAALEAEFKEQTAAASRERSVIIGFLLANLVAIVLHLWRGQRSDPP